MAYYAINPVGKLMERVEGITRSNAADSNGPGPGGVHFGPEETYIIEVYARARSIGGGWHISLPAPGRGNSAPNLIIMDNDAHLEPLTEHQAAVVGGRAIQAMLDLDKGYG